MPTYQYACTSCGEQLEVVQKFSDEPLTECPACGGRLRKVFSPVGVVFKGSGFYKTDSRTSAKKSASADKSEATDKTGATDKKDSSGTADKTSSDTKAADKPAASSSSSGQVA